MTTELLNKWTYVRSSDDISVQLEVTSDSGVTNLNKFEAIKLRNFLNKFINGEFVEDEE